MYGRLTAVRGIELPPSIADDIHPDRLRQLVREGRSSPTQLLARYTPARRRATLAATILDPEPTLIDAALDMADRIIGGSFTRGGNAKKRRRRDHARRRADPAPLRSDRRGARESAGERCRRVRPG